MQKIFWDTILDKQDIEIAASWKDVAWDAKKVFDDIQIHYCINKVLEGLNLPDHGEVKLNFSDLNLSEHELDEIPEITLEDNFELRLVDDSQVSSHRGDQKILRSEKSDSTSTSSQRQMNLELLEEFNNKQSKFVYLLHHTNFEDGLENDATEFFSKLFKKDPCISLFWLSGVYTENMTDIAVVEGILRIISMLDAVEYRKYILPLVKASFNDKNVEVQEAAIMVAEKWRNKMCLEALQTTSFASKWIQEYANQVMDELKEELADEISEDD